MRRLLSILSLVFASCVALPRPVPPTVPPVVVAEPPVVVAPEPPAPAPHVLIKAVVTDFDSGRVLEDATIYADNGARREQTGRVQWDIEQPGWNLCAERAEYDTQCIPISEAREYDVNFRLFITFVPPPPVVVVPPVIVAPPAPVVAARPTRADILNVQTNFCNLLDAAGNVMFTPMITGANDAQYADWMTRLREAGSTHIIMGPFTPGPVYPGVAWDNPDLEADTARLRAFIIKVLETPSANGRGFVPVIFLDGGGRAPRERIDRVWPRLARALEGLHQYLLVLPAWEPVIGDWSSAEVSYGLTRAHELFPQSVLGYHGSPKRLVGSSNPPEPDDPWRSGEAEFYQAFGGQHIEVAFYQTEHGRDIYAGYCDPGDLLSGTPEQDRCWLNRWQDYVARIGAGLRGWRKLPQLVAFETVAYEFFRRQATSEQARMVADAMKRVCDKFAVTCGYGNGLPR